MYKVEDGKPKKIYAWTFYMFQQKYNVPDIKWTPAYYNEKPKPELEERYLKIIKDIERRVELHKGEPISQIYDEINTWIIEPYDIEYLQEYNEGKITLDTVESFMRLKLLEIYGWLGPINEYKKQEDKEFNNALKRHRCYKQWYIPGVILWMSSCFWIPFLLGMIDGSTTDFSPRSQFLGMLVVGFEYLCAASFTFPVTLPASFAMAVWGHPYLLKRILFNKNCPYNEALMNTLGHSKEQEKQNATAVIAGTILGEISKKKEK